MLIFGERHFLETEFDNESEIEAIVFKKYEYLFGPGSFVIPRAKIKTEQGSASIPDGFIIDLETKNWYVVEVELIRHGVWTHIAPQVSKQLIASQQDLSRKLLIEVAVNLYKENESIRRIFEDEQIPDIDVRRILADIMEKPPIIGIPIDRVTSDLRQWAESLRVQVKLWSVKKYQLLDGRETIYEFPGEFRPILDTAEINSNSRRTIAYYDVTLKDLIEADLLSIGEELSFIYNPRGADSASFTAIVEDDGSLRISSRVFSSPSIAAVFCMQQTGSNRQTENGWRVWKNQKNKSLEQLRKIYLNAAYDFS